MTSCQLGAMKILVSSSMIPLTMAVEPISLPLEQDPAQELTADDMKALAYGPSKTT